MPYAESFLTLHTPYGEDELSREGAPSWSKQDFEQLLTELGWRGYGWLHPAGVRAKVEELATAYGDRTEKRYVVDYDWSSFYEAALRDGPKLFRGFAQTAEDLRSQGLIRNREDIFEYIVEGAKGQTCCPPANMEAALAAGAQYGGLREGVLQALEAWRESVVDHFHEQFHLDWSVVWEDVEIDTDSPIIDLLVDAARPDKV